MSITVNIYYTGKNGSARKFAEEMIKSGTVEKIRNEDGNLRYEYFQPIDDPETILLIGQIIIVSATQKKHILQGNHSVKC